MMEEKCEKFCGRACSIYFFLTPMVGVVASLGEFAWRPEMPSPHGPLHGQYAVVTGGCGAIGSETARLMVSAGANVVIGCRNQSQAAEYAQRIGKSAATSPAAAAADEEDDELGEATGPGSIKGWELKLDSHQSVEKFATRYKKEIGETFGLQMLVLNGATTAACAYTGDSLEATFHVNHLSHFTLANMLLPSLKKNAVTQGSRVVSVVCDAAYTTFESGGLNLLDLNADRPAGAEVDIAEPFKRCGGTC
jgi:NAD(P)-dependent dehydrogenase (short-subunit alcohol dehydrogenase family)